jgi:hypothetical protein
MSTGLSIVKATYGTSTSITDVTNTVAALVLDGSLKFTVSTNTLNTTDPAPGQLKTLTVTYTINGGSSNQISKNDNDIISIEAPPVRVASGLQITKAEYGYPGNYTDVTNAVQSQASNGSINLKVGFSAVGIPDPNPNKQKELKVEYTINGKKSTESIKDGSPFKISAPAVQAPDNKTPTQHGMSVIYSIFSNMLLFFAVVLYTVSVFMGVNYGNQFISPMLWGPVCFFMPGFGYLIIMATTFIVRLFKSQDFIV